MGRTAKGAALCAALVLLAPVAAGASSVRFDGPTVANPVVVPNFALHDQHGRRVSLAGERGHVVLLTFLYTHCPDLCPLTAEYLNAVLARTRGARVLAVSVDPRGDTPASVRRFVRVHRLLPAFHYLTGPAPELARIWVTYHVWTVKRDGHTLYTMLIDKRGRDRVLYDSTATPDAIAHDVRLLSGGSGGAR